MSKFVEKIKEKKNQIFASGAVATAATLTPTLAFAADGTASSAMTSVTGALKSSISDVASNIGTAVGDNLPVILGVAGVFIVIPAIWKLARRFTK